MTCQPAQRLPWPALVLRAVGACALVAATACLSVSPPPLRRSDMSGNSDQRLGPEDVPVEGAWVSGRALVAAEYLDFEGELLAVDDQRLVLNYSQDQHKQVYQVHLRDLQTLTVHDQASWPILQQLGVTTGGMAVSLPINGLTVLFSWPVWMLMGGHLMASSAFGDDLEVPKQDRTPEVLAPLARFPAGLPAAWLKGVLP